MEKWEPIEEFPGYEVSDEGRVRNERTGRLLGIYDNGHGVLQVVMRRDGKNHARAVHRLVAEAHLFPGPQGTVPFFLNGDRTDCSAKNLDWKPRWYAIKMTRQSKRTEPRDTRGIRMLSTGQEFPNALEAAKFIGGIEELVLLTAQNRHGATYMGSAFEFIYPNT
jgi:hypothetical protein